MPIAICKSHPAVIAISLESCNVRGHEWFARCKSITSVWNQLTPNLVSEIVNTSHVLAFFSARKKFESRFNAPDKIIKWKSPMPQFSRHQHVLIFTDTSFQTFCSLQWMLFTLWRNHDVIIWFFCRFWTWFCIMSHHQLSIKRTHVHGHTSHNHTSPFHTSPLPNTRLRNNLKKNHCQII